MVRTNCTKRRTRRTGNTPHPSCPSLCIYTHPIRAPFVAWASRPRIFGSFVSPQARATRISTLYQKTPHFPTNAWARRPRHKKRPAITPVSLYIQHPNPCLSAQIRGPLQTEPHALILKSSRKRTAQRDGPDGQETPLIHLVHLCVYTFLKSVSIRANPRLKILSPAR